MERKLVAIMACDMVGFSRLMELDEEDTLARLKAYRSGFIDPTIKQNHGRIIKTTGDGMLVEFSSVVDAVRTAVDIQEQMHAHNENAEPDRRIQFRMGINLGDVIVDGDDIFGDGVNVAARIEQLASAGGICITASVFNELTNKIDIDVDDMGERELKNISRPVQVFGIIMGGEYVGDTGADAGSQESPEDRDHRSVAVLPFTNMSGDPEQEFFADGLSEDILTELARFKDLFVISRNSSFVYKGQAVNLQEVAKTFNVRYIVEGSVRKAGNRVRITAQLIDAVEDRHIWAERYDRDLDDIFAIQDEVTAAIVATLPGRVEAASQDSVKRKPTENMAAYECVLAAKVLHHRSTINDNARAQVMIDRAVELDPEYAHAHAWRACINGQAWVYGWCEDKDATWEIVLEELDKAIALDDNDADVHRILAATSLAHDDHEASEYHQQRGLQLNPNYDLIVVQQGELLTWLGRPEEGVEWIQKAMRLNPHHPKRFWNHLGRAYFAAHRNNEAVDAFKRLSSPDQFHNAFLAAANALMGDETAAKAYATEVLKIDPDFTISSYMETMHYKLESDAEHHRMALEKAGLPA
ncbi:MAG: adenylate/guanylate cyclase domain-containing protein [Hyphomicrobiales bacterium]